MYEIASKAAICVLILASGLSAISYDRFEVWRANPSTHEEVKFLRGLGKSMQIDYWKEATTPEKPVDFLVDPNNKRRIEGALQRKGIKYTTLISKGEELVRKQMEENHLRKQKSSKALQSILDFDYSVYHDYDQVVEWIDTVADEFPTFTERKQIGVTHEGRPMYALKFSKSTGATDKPVIFVDALIHSREWITTASLLFIFKEMLTNEAYDHMMSDADWYFVPMINIDGYVHTWTENRLWRKTRTTGASSACVGVDGNRNWDSYWSVSGSSGDPCTYSYHGPTPVSEPVIRQLSTYVLSVGKIDAYVSTHSYSQLILYPYNYANVTTEDQELLDSTSRKMRDAMYAVHGTEYVYGIGATTLYEFSGTTTDWTYDVAKVKLSYTFELRDTGEYGFLLPPDQIIPTGEEYLEGLVVLKNEVTGG